MRLSVCVQVFCGSWSLIYPRFQYFLWTGPEYSFFAGPTEGGPLAQAPGTLEPRGEGPKNNSGGAPVVLNVGQGTTATNFLSFDIFQKELKMRGVHYYSRLMKSCIRGRKAQQVGKKKVYISMRTEADFWLEVKRLKAKAKYRKRDFVEAVHPAMCANATLFLELQKETTRTLLKDPRNLYLMDSPLGYLADWSVAEAIKLNRTPIVMLSARAVETWVPQRIRHLASLCRAGPAEKALEWDSCIEAAAVFTNPPPSSFTSSMGPAPSPSIDMAEEEARRNQNKNSSRVEQLFWPSRNNPSRLARAYSAHLAKWKAKAHVIVDLFENGKRGWSAKDVAEGLRKCGVLQEVKLTDGDGEEGAKFRLQVPRRRGCRIFKSKDEKRRGEVSIKYLYDA